MTDTTTKSMNTEDANYKRGVADGIQSKGLKTPYHDEWEQRPLNNVPYENGYWAGYNS